MDAAVSRFLELDPAGTQVLNQEAAVHLEQGDAAGASALMDRCLAISPEASMCRLNRAVLHASTGACLAELDDARELVKLEPDIDSSYSLLAQALVATGAPLESVRGALRQVDEHIVPSTSTPKGLVDLLLAVLVGDFVTADTLAVAAAESVGTSSSERDHAPLGLLRIKLAEEIGDRRKALAIADDLDKQASAWTPDAPGEVRMKRVYLQHEAGLLTDDAFSAARGRLMDQALQMMPPGTRTPEMLRLLQNAQHAETAAEAEWGLPREPLVVHTASEAALLGRLLWLSGRVDEALPALERATRSCELIASLSTSSFGGLETTLDYLHVSLFRAEALESKGDKAGACAAYKVIEERWRDAKPRSVTAAKAKERLAALGCTR
jgi:serine/threonine-protein kinase